MTRTVFAALGFASLALLACNPAPKATADEPVQVAPSKSADAPARRAATASAEAGEPLKPALAHGVPLADGDSLWAGKLGKAEIVVELRVKGNNVGGRYYYKKYGRSLVLSGRKKVAALDLQEQGGGGDTVFGEALASLELQSAASSLTGKWTSLAGEKKSLTVALTRVLQGTYDELRVRKEAPVASQDGSFKTQSSTHLHEHLVYCKTDTAPPMDVALVPGLKALEEECHFAFEGKKGKRIIIEGKTVSIVEAKAGLKWKEANQVLTPDVVPDVGESWEGNYSVKVVFAQGHLLTVERTTSGLGLGAYPAHDQYGQTIDLRTGRAVTWDDLLEEPGSADFRSALLKTRSKTDDCAWTEIWSEDDGAPPLYPHLDAQGLHVTPIFPHVSKACQYEAFGTLVPKDLARRYAKRGGLLPELLPAP